MAKTTCTTRRPGTTPGRLMAINGVIGGGRWANPGGYGLDPKGLAPGWPGETPGPVVPLNVHLAVATFTEAHRHSHLLFLSTSSPQSLSFFNPASHLLVTRLSRFTLVSCSPHLGLYWQRNCSSPSHAQLLDCFFDFAFRVCRSILSSIFFQVLVGSASGLAASIVAAN